jgi:amidase
LCKDHVGPLARTVLETAQLLDAITGYDGIDDRGFAAPKCGTIRFAATLESSGTRLTGIKIGILKESFDMPMLNVRVKDAVLTAAHKFSSLGATV